jgi:23S rRNA pseudouridine2605 synthase
MADEQGRRDLTEFTADRPERLFHVGRLDTDTSGLLVLTNDGDLAHRLAHPSFEITKTYVALVEGSVGDAVGRRLREGVELDDGPASVDRFVVKDRGRGRSLVELDLHMGRNRIVRRLLADAGHPVVELTRTAFGPVRIGSLAVGRTRELTREELGDLFDTVSA